MTPIRYRTFREAIREQINFHFSMKLEVNPCDVGEILHQLDPVLLITLNHCTDGVETVSINPEDLDRVQEALITVKA